MKYRYYLGEQFVCESSAKVKFGERYSAIRETVEDTKKKKSAVEATDEIKIEEEQ